MKFTLATTLALLATALATPVTLDPRSDAQKYEIVGLDVTKKNGKKISAVSFAIHSAQSATGDHNCSLHDPDTRQEVTHFRKNKLYACSGKKNEIWSFKYIPSGKINGEATLYLYEKTSDGAKLQGKTSFGEPICRAGGRGSMICQPPQMERVFITVHA